MTKPRPCGCKGCRTCLICETQYGAENLKLRLKLDQSKGYVYCPYCNKAWPGWDINSYKQHPNHDGESIDYPGVYVQLDFLSETEEQTLVTNLDEIPWDISQSGRRKQNYGPKTNFKKRKIVPGAFRGYPECTKFIQERFSGIELLKGYQVIEQCSLEYEPSKGASIDPHIDDCWIWGERIVTVNCLSDSVLTMTRFHGENTKYNLPFAYEHPAAVNSDGSICMKTLRNENDCKVSMFEASKPKDATEFIVRIPMPRRSLLILYGEARYHWEHCVLREDVTSRRVCIAYREFTPPYLMNGTHQNIGDQVRQKAQLFWDHRQHYNLG